MPLNRYKPKRWEPRFDLIVLGSIAGKSNVELASQFGLTPQHISNIINTQQAENLKQKVRNNIENESTKDIRTVVTEIGNRAAKHLLEFVLDERGRAKSNPFEFIDRSIKIAQISGVVKNDNGGGNVSPGMHVQNLQVNVLNGLAEALKLSREVETVHSNAIDRTKEVKLIDVTPGTGIINQTPLKLEKVG